MSRIYVLAFVPQSSRGPSALQPHYSISIESDKPSRHFRSSSDQVAMFDSRNTTASSQTTPENSSSSRPAARVLVAHKKHSITITKVQEALQQNSSSTSESSWLDSRLTSLQTAGMLDTFSPAKFRQWLDDTLKSHIACNNTETLDIDYTAMLKSSRDTKAMLNPDPPTYTDTEPSREKTFWGFRVSRPHPRSGRLQDYHTANKSRDVYGGLM